MSTNESDLEYGPTPDGAQHEHTDIEPAIARNFAIWLAVAMIISAAIVYGTFWFFEGRAATRDQTAQVYPLAAGRALEPPAPRLQTQPFKDVYLLRQAEREKLTTYGWVDRNAGVVRIPIDEAMRLIERRGLPVREGGTAGSLGQVVQDSTGGRTTAPR
ncbi:MAG: hypothetical protein AB1635_00440 [Acidobacteriota bacterium]